LTTRAAGTLHLAWKLLLRDWRAGELTVLAAALLVAVAAMTGVAFLTDRVGQAVELRAAESLAADLRLASTSPPGGEYEALAAQRGLSTARVSSMPSVVFAGEANTLAAVSMGLYLWIRHPAFRRSIQDTPLGAAPLN
jgi:putative ABC transport system permease protein